MTAGLTNLKWSMVGLGIYESGPWTISRHDGYPHSGTSWAIYKNGAFIARVRTLAEAKGRVQRSAVDG